MDTGSFPAVKRSGRDLNHPPHLAPRLKKEQSYSSTPSWSVLGRIVFDRSETGNVSLKSSSGMDELAKSIEQSPSWEAKRSTAYQEIRCTVWDPNVYCRNHKRPPPVPILSQINPVHAKFEVFAKCFRNTAIVYGKEVLSWRITPSRQSATAYSVHSQLPSISAGRSSIRSLTTRHAVVTGTQLSRSGTDQHRRSLYDRISRWK